jgi:hypothetical protein
MTDKEPHIEWHDEFVDLFGKDVPFDFRANKDNARQRWSNGLSHINAFNNDFMVDCLRWGVQKFERKQSGEITRRELELMVWAFLRRNKDPQADAPLDPMVRFQSIKERMKHNRADVFKVWDLICMGASDYECRKLHNFAEDELGLDFKPVHEEFIRRRREALEGVKQGITHEVPKANLYTPEVLSEPDWVE